MAVTFLKLIPLKDIEPQVKWEDFCQDPLKLFQAFTKYFAVEARFLDSVASIKISPDTPSAEDRAKIWIKTSFPYAIGVMIDGDYQMDYGVSGLVPFAPFLRKPSDLVPMPAGVRELSNEEIKDFGLINTNADAPNRYKWFIFTPDSITI